MPSAGTKPVVAPDGRGQVERGQLGGQHRPLGRPRRRLDPQREPGHAVGPDVDARDGRASVGGHQPEPGGAAPGDPLEPAAGTARPAWRRRASVGPATAGRRRRRWAAGSGSTACTRAPGLVAPPDGQAAVTDEVGLAAGADPVDPPVLGVAPPHPQVASARRAAGRRRRSRAGQRHLAASPRRGPRRTSRGRRTPAPGRAARWRVASLPLAGAGAAAWGGGHGDDEQRRRRASAPQEPFLHRTTRVKAVGGTEVAGGGSIVGVRQVLLLA